MSSNVGQIIGLNKAAPQNHQPTVVGQAYTLFQYKRQLFRLLQMTTALGAAKVVFEVGAVRAARLTGSTKLEKCAQVAVDILGMANNFSWWVMGKVLHTVADSVVSCVPNSDNYLARAAKDVTIIFTSELANKASQTISANVNARITEVRNRSLDNSQRVKNAQTEYEKAVEYEQSLKEKNQQITNDLEDPQVLVNHAKNIARDKGLEGNKDQISLECSRQVNGYSIAPVDSDRNIDTFSAAQAGRHADDYLVERMRELQTVILQENGIALVQARVAKDLAFINAQVEQGKLNSVDELVSKVNQVWSDVNLDTINVAEGEIVSEEDIVAWINEAYVEHENKAKASNNEKLAIANGMAKFIMDLTGQTEPAARDHYTHVFLECMDDSSRRWYNDVAGKTYELLTGATTDHFVYKPHGGQKIWREVTRPLKNVLNEVNKVSDGQKPVIIGVQVGFNGAVAATVNNQPVFKIHEPKQNRRISPRSNPKPKAESAKTAPKDKKNETPVPAVKENSTDHEEAKKSNKKGASSHAKAVDSESSKEHESFKEPNPSNGLGTVNNINTIVHEGVKKAIGYSPFGKLGHTLDVFDEANKGYGTGITAWNLSYATALGVNPLISVTTASASLYCEHVPEVAVSQIVTIMNEQSNYYEDFNGFGMREAANELRVSAVLVQNVDAMIRKTNRYAEALFMTPEKIENAYMKINETQSNLIELSEGCGVTRSEQVKKQILNIAVESLGVLGEGLRVVIDSTKDK